MRQDEQSRAMAQCFGGIATDYDRLRPAPPAEALDWLLPAAASDAVEIGAGTGLLTRQLVDRVARVQAVEPDARMREVLAQRVPQAEVVAAGAEELPFDDGSADVVIASSAWHWVDEARAVPEVGRVLRPGGFLSLLWSGADRSVDWVRALWAGGRELASDQAEALDAGRRDRHRVHLGPDSPFGEPETRVLRWSAPMTTSEVIGWAGTYSAVISMEASERARHLDAMAQFLHAHHPGDDRVEIPMRCLCWRAIRR